MNDILCLNQSKSYMILHESWMLFSVVFVWISRRLSNRQGQESFCRPERNSPASLREELRTRSQDLMKTRESENGRRDSWKKTEQLECFVARINEVFPETFSYEFENGSEDLTRTKTRNEKDTTMT
jgi:hypothetical protein